MSSFLKTLEVAKLLRMSPEGVRALVAEGHLKARRVKPTGHLLFDLQDVQQALREARPLEPVGAAH